MTDIPRWPKISLLDDPDEEERAKRQLNESRRKRGLEPLYPEAGFPPPPPSFAELLIGGGRPIPPDRYRNEPPDPENPDPDPRFHLDPKDIVIKDAAPEPGGADPQVAQAERPPATPAEGKGADAAPAPDKESAAPPKPGKPLTYEQVKELVRENNRSKLPDELIIAVIFKESSFKPWERNRDPKSSEAGLMQVSKRAWEDVHQNVLKQREVPDFNQHIFDPVTNIQRGSAYLQLRIDRLRGDVSGGLNGYRGGVEPGYAADVLAATRALQQNPSDPIAALSKAYRRPYP